MANQQDENVVPQELQDFVEAGALITGGLAGLFSISSLGLSMIETGDPLTALKKEAGIEQLEKGLEKANNSMEQMM